MALADTITALGTSIINLVGTRSKTDLSNITTAGQNVIKSLASGVPVGTVIAYMGTSAPDGFLLMDGGEYSKTTYAALYAVVGDSMGTATDPDKFVIADMTDGRYLMGSTVAGSSIVAGLPNITGRVVTDNYPAGPDMITDGCFTKVETYGTFKTSGTQNYTLPSTCNFNASSSSTIYGSSNTVTPLSESCLFCIRY